MGKATGAGMAAAALLLACGAVDAGGVFPAQLIYGKGIALTRYP